MIIWTKRGDKRLWECERYIALQCLDRLTVLKWHDQVLKSVEYLNDFPEPVDLLQVCNRRSLELRRLRKLRVRHHHERLHAVLLCDRLAPLAQLAKPREHLGRQYLHVVDLLALVRAKRRTSTYRRPIHPFDAKRPPLRKHALLHLQNTMRPQKRIQHFLLCARVPVRDEKCVVLCHRSFLQNRPLAPFLTCFAAVPLRFTACLQVRLSARIPFFPAGLGEAKLTVLRSNRGGSRS